jgi:hypothetical protein
MRRGLVSALLVLFNAACDDDTGDLGSHVLVVAPEETDAVGEHLVAEASSYLEKIVGSTPTVVRVDADAFDDLERVAADAGAGLVLVLDADRLAADRVSAARMATLGTDGFVLQAEDEGKWRSRLDGRGATFVLTAGNTALSRQYGVYEFLRRLGARFYHPEQEYVPRVEAEHLRARARQPTVLHRLDDYLPDYANARSWSFHSAHPLEQLEAFSDGDHPIDEALDVNLWQVKNKGNRFRGAGRGIASDESRARREAELEAMRVEMGFPRGTGITLHNEQQGASGEIDRDSPVPIQEQIDAIVTQKLADIPDAEWFGIHFGPTELTTTPDQETIAWINWAGQKALALKPDIDVEVNVHITGSQPTEHEDDLGCPNGTNDDSKLDYYDLAFVTDERFRASVHTVMFYPLEGPARVYNQQSFAHKLCLMQKASADGRPLQWFPEGSWWLSFDNPIPVYLPLYMWARDRDNALLRPLLASRGGGTLDAYRMFNSGQEWGYWQQDYAVGMWAWNADVTLEQVLGELFDPLCDPSEWREGCWARTTAIEVLGEVMEHQREFFLERVDWQGNPGGLYTYWAGEDQADVIAASSGLAFRPVRVPFDTVRGWGEPDLTIFAESDLVALAEAVQAYRPWIDRLEGVASTVPDAGQPWLAEVIDGLVIDKLRAEQALHLYQSLIDYRRSEIAGAADPSRAAQREWLAAQSVLAEATAVIARREAAYRYPADQMYGGGLTADTAIANGTTYPYRVHTKTHLLTYWHNRNEEVRVLLGGGGLLDSVELTAAIASPGTPLAIAWPTVAGLEGSVMIGDAGTIGPADTMLELGAQPGFWAVSGSFSSDGTVTEVRGGIARSSVRARMLEDGGLTLLEPASETAQNVLAAVFPVLQWAWLDSPAAVVLGYEIGGEVDYEGVVRARVVEGDAAGFTTEVFDIDVPVATTSGGDPVLVSLTNVTLSGSLGAPGFVSPIGLQGRISIGDLVDALVALAGADEEGALTTLAGILMFDPADPPETVPVRAEFGVEPISE